MRTPRPASWWIGSYTYLAFFVGLLVWLPLLAVVALFNRRDPTRRVRGRWLRHFGSTIPRLTPIWDFRIEGSFPEDIGQKPYVVVANHESTADIFLLARLPWDMRWVAKAEIFKMPLIGWIMRLGGDIPIKRGRGGSVRAMLQACRETLDRGLPVMLFPEGTRSTDGRLLPFRDGAFELAIEAGVPVVPVAVAGSRDCRMPGSIWFAYAEACARVLPPFPTAGLRLEDAPRLREQVRQRIAVEVAALQAELGIEIEPLPEEQQATTSAAL